MPVKFAAKSIPIPMKSSLKIFAILVALLAFNCGGKEKKDDGGFEMQRGASQTETKPTETTDMVKASERVDLTNKGVGPVASLTLDPQINQELAAEGEAVYNQMCLACHKVGKKFIGPAPNGILERRTPEWVMNMILAPEKMVKEDPLAKDLLIEFNGSPMANQGLCSL